MARNRMIKPEFWDDEKISKISYEARLTYIGLWNFSDDYAVIKGNPIWLKSKIYPYDENLNLKTFKKWIAELESTGRIFLFKENSEKYYFIPKFLEHQKINRPSKQRNPVPPKKLINDSRPTHDMLIDENKIREVKLKQTENKTGVGPADRHFKTDLNDRVVKQIKASCDNVIKTQDKKIKFNPFQWVQFWANKNAHPSAILDSLDGLVKARLIGTEIPNPWAYADKIIKTKSGNYYERETITESEKYRYIQINEKLSALIENIGV